MTIRETSQRDSEDGAASGTRQSGMRDRFLAAVCGWCPLCRQARRKGKGVAYRLVRNVESGICPFCRAYERVNGHPAHEGLRVKRG
jgi:hypothetical protein